MCHSFISVKNNKKLQKSAQKARELSQKRDRWTQLGMKRKQGGGLFKTRVPPKPKHAIDFIWNQSIVATSQLAYLGGNNT